MAEASGSGVCQCCLGHRDCLNMMASYLHAGVAENYAEMLMETFSVSVEGSSSGTDADSKPLICCECVPRLRDAHAFRAQLQRAQARLREQGECKYAETIKEECELWEEEDVWPLGAADCNVPSQEQVELCSDAGSDENVPAAAEEEARQACTQEQGEFEYAETIKEECELWEEEDMRPLGAACDVPSQEKVELCSDAGSDENVAAAAEEEARQACTQGGVGGLHQAGDACGGAGALLHASSSATETRNLFVCDICSQSFKLKRTLVSHLKAHNCQKPNDSAKCSTASCHKSNLKKQFNIDIKTYTCQYCNSKFSRNSQLKIHLRAHTGEKPYICKYCNTAFSDNGSLKNHLRTHTGKKPYICNICNSTFSRKDYLQRHLTKHTGEKPYICNICNSTFSRKDYLQTHLRKHTGEKPYICKYCNAAISDNGKLQRHLRKHTGEKPYICKYCKKAFSQNNHLKRHLRTHTGEKPYICKYCSAAFSDNGNLKKHLRTHTGEKPYICNICNSTFIRKDYLQTHLRKHTGEKPYICKYCKKAFSQNNHFNRHLRTQHC